MKSLEQIVQETFGQLQWVIATLRAENEKLKAELEALKKPNDSN